MPAQQNSINNRSPLHLELFDGRLMLKIYRRRKQNNTFLNVGSEQKLRYGTSVRQIVLAPGVKQPSLKVTPDSEKKESLGKKATRA